MTIKEVATVSSKGNEFVAASCTRCIRNYKLAFHIRIDNPTEDQIGRVRYKAARHDRKGDHPVTITINRIQR